MFKVIARSLLALFIAVSFIYLTGCSGSAGGDPGPACADAMKAASAGESVPGMPGLVDPDSCPPGPGPSENTDVEILAILPIEGPVGQEVTISVANSAKDTDTVFLGDTQIEKTANDTGDAYVIVVPTTATAGIFNIYIKNGDLKSNEVAFTVTETTTPPPPPPAALPQIVSVEPTEGPVETPLTIKVSNFDAATDTFQFGDKTVTLTAVPGATPGPDGELDYTSAVPADIAVEADVAAVPYNLSIKRGEQVSNLVSFNVIAGENDDGNPSGNDSHHGGGVFGPCVQFAGTLGGTTTSCVNGPVRGIIDVARSLDGLRGQIPGLDPSDNCPECVELMELVNGLLERLRFDVDPPRDISDTILSVHGRLTKLVNLRGAGVAITPQVHLPAAVGNTLNNLLVVPATPLRERFDFQ